MTRRMRIDVLLDLTGRGRAVLLVLPRGGDGYGAKSHTGVSGAGGESQAQDLPEPPDRLVEERVADQRGPAVTGCPAVPAVTEAG